MRIFYIVVSPDDSITSRKNFLVLQLLMLQPSVVYTEAEPPSLKSLITDPYIVLAAGTKSKDAICDLEIS